MTDVRALIREVEHEARPRWWQCWPNFSLTHYWGAWTNRQRLAGGVLYVSDYYQHRWCARCHLRQSRPL